MVSNGSIIIAMVAWTLVISLGLTCKLYTNSDENNKPLWDINDLIPTENMTRDWEGWIKNGTAIDVQCDEPFGQQISSETANELIKNIGKLKELNGGKRHLYSWYIEGLVNWRKKDTEIDDLLETSKQHSYDAMAMIICNILVPCCFMIICIDPLKVVIFFTVVF